MLERPHYMQEFRTLAGEMLEDAPIISGPSPPNLISKQLSFLPGVFADLAPIGNLLSSSPFCLLLTSSSAPFSFCHRRVGMIYDTYKCL